MGTLFALDVCYPFLYLKISQYFCCPAIESMTGIVRYALDTKDKKVGNVLLARASELWRSIWEHRHQFKSLRTYLDREDNFAEPLVELIADYANLYQLQ